MKAIFAILFVILLGSSVAARADDAVWAQKIHRIEYIHFNPVEHTVEWAISGGTINDLGEFVPGDSGISSYTINLSSGSMTHNGEDGVLSPGATKNMLRAFGGLSQLMQGYTENWQGISPSPASTAEDKDAPSPDSREDIAGVFGLSLISQPLKDFVPSTAPSHIKKGRARSGHAYQHGVRVSMVNASH